MLPILHLLCFLYLLYLLYLQHLQYLPPDTRCSSQDAAEELLQAFRGWVRDFTAAT